MSTTLRVKGIIKRFPGINALSWDEDDEIIFKSGVIYALLGENGAGKSTLSKIIAGIYQRDGGEIYLDEKPFNPSTSKESRDYGVGIVMQEEGLMTTLKVSENLMARSEKEFSKYGIYSIKKQRALAKGMLEAVCPWIDPDTVVNRLSLEDQKMVELARAIYTWPKILLIDEATAALSKDNTEKLIGFVKQAKEHGSIVIMVTHRMEEVFQHCDSAVIMKDGKLVGEYPVSELNLDKVSRLMVGRSIKNERNRTEHGFHGDSIVLKLTNGSFQDRFHDINLELHQGEILGIAGLNGGGKDELLPALFGEVPLTTGTVEIYGKEYKNINPRNSINMDIAYVPKFRDRDGLMLRQPIGLNILLPLYKKINKGGFISHRTEKRVSETYSKALMVKCGSINDAVDSLSGGNRQKVILARWMAYKSKLFFIDNPTRGIDVGARAEIYRLLNKLTDEGCSVIMVSDDLPEILSMSDRIMVIRHGSVSKVFEKVDGLKEHDIVINMI